MKNTILIVDDNELNRDILKEILSESFAFEEAEDGNIAIQKLYLHENLNDLSAILLDLVMPNVDGKDVLRYIKEHQIHKTIPVLIISGDTDPQNVEFCFNNGAFDFIPKPFDKTLIHQRIHHAIDWYKHTNELESLVVEQNEKIEEQNFKLNKINFELINTLASVVEARSLESGLHIKRVAKYSEILARDIMNNYPEYNLTDDDVATITNVSILHDVGKIMIPDSILLKAGPLTAEEWETMKLHTIYGCQILDNIEIDLDRNYIETAHDVIKYHHEKYDGKGYPEGLSGDQIPISAQIVSMADAFDALITKRAYKPAYEPEIAYQMILAGQCGAFSNKLKKSLCRCFSKMNQVFLDSKDCII